MTQASCRQVALCLEAFVDGELDAADMLSIEAHVQSCASCADRVALSRATRRMVRHAVRHTRPSDDFRRRMAQVVVEASDARARTDVMVGSGRMLSWRVTAPMAAAAGFVLIWASVGKLPAGWLDTQQAPANSNAQAPVEASAASVETLLDDLIDQHVHPLPPETTNPTELPTFDRFVGVPVRAPSLKVYDGRLVGGRLVPIRQQRAAMLQYVLTNGSRVSVYVYNPRRVRIAASPVLRQRVIDDSPMYVGYVRGFSVAVADRRGVGYAVASDLDEQQSSRILLAVGNR